MRFQTNLSSLLLFIVASLLLNRVDAWTQQVNFYRRTSGINSREKITSTLKPNTNKYTSARTSRISPVLLSPDSREIEKDDKHNSQSDVNDSSNNLKDDKFSPSSLSRREIFSKSAFTFFMLSAATAPPLFAYPTEVKAEEENTSKNILITGSNSGIGFDAALRIAASSSASQKHNIIVACRSLSKAQDAVSRIESALEDSSSISYCKLIPAECDLADLSSIKQFVSDTQKSNIGMLDVVCFNAGLALNTAAKEVARTKDGFELTIGTNHLGHFYLNSLLMPMIDQNSGRIVVTASGVHDPESPGGAQGSKATLGDLSGLENAVAKSSKVFDMIDGGSYDADKAYKDSKLCNVLFTRELQKRLNAANSNIKAYCFNPGLIVGTGLFRDQNQVFTKVFDVAATNVFKVGETTSWGGGALEYLALSPDIGIVNGKKEGGLYYTSPPGSSKFGDSAYGNQFTISQVSKEASDDTKAARLWVLSEKLVGLS